MKEGLIVNSWHHVALRGDGVNELRGPCSLCLAVEVECFPFLDRLLLMKIKQLMRVEAGPVPLSLHQTGCLSGACPKLTISINQVGLYFLFY